MSAKIYDAMLVAQKYEDVRTKLMNAHMALSDVMRSLAVEQLTAEERATYYSIIDKLLSMQRIEFSEHAAREYVDTHVLNVRKNCDERLIAIC
jgi:hypothetical protein